MGNGEWGMGNGEWGMGNGEWGMEECTDYVLTFRPLARDVPPDVRVRMLLKHALRGLGLKCTRARPETSMPSYQILFILDGEHERRVMAYPFVPAAGQVIVFAAGEKRVEARVEQVWWVEPAGLFEVYLFRPSRLPCMNAEAELWRAAGFAVPEEPARPAPWRAVGA